MRSYESGGLGITCLASGFIEDGKMHLYVPSSDRNQFSDRQKLSKIHGNSLLDLFPLLSMGI